MSGNVGTTVVLVELFADMSPTPAIVEVGFRWQPQSNEAQMRVLGQGGLREALERSVGQLGWKKATGRWTFPWTDKSKAGLAEWFRLLSANGFLVDRLTDVLKGLERVPAATETPTLTRLAAGFGAIPQGALIRIDSLEKCPEELWHKLTDVPGVFWVLPSGRPMPIRGTWAKQYFRSHNMHPSPVYVSAIHVEQVARLFPHVAAARDQIRREMGLDYPIYGPEYFPIPVRNIDPDTGRPFALRPYQAEAVSKFLAMKRALVTLPVGSGKCHRKGQKLLMYNGTIKTVEALSVGDRLMGPDSKPRTILSVTRGHGSMCKVIPRRGEPFVVNTEHVLTLVKDKSYPFGTDTKDVSIIDWQKWSKYKKACHRLLRAGIEFQSTNAPLSIPPYILGLLLGDGTMSQSGSVAITTMDPEVLKEMNSFASLWGLELHPQAVTGCVAPTYYFVGTTRTKQRDSLGRNRMTRYNPLLTELKGLGLLPIGCKDKFVPFNYLVSSRADRLLLLAGLLDTDGSMRDGTFRFVNTSKSLVDGVVFLARSLGLSAYVSSGKTTYMVFIGGNCHLIPTRIARKRAGKVQKTKPKNVLHVGFDVEFLDQEEDYYGFTLDGDGRYLLEDFTVTHNTAVGMGAANCLLSRGIIDRVVIIAPESLLKDVWAKELFKFYGILPVVAHGEAKYRRRRIVEAAKSGSKYILATYDSFRMQDAQTYLVPLLGPRTMVIIDEAHHLKHEDSKRYSSLRKALDGIRPTPTGERFDPMWVTPWRLFMTGTPDHDKLIDLYALIQLLGFHAWSTEDEFQSLYFHRETVYTNKKDAMGNPVTKQRVVRVNPEKMLALQEVASSVGFYRTYEQIGIQLPPVIRRDWTIDPTGYERAAYEVIKGHVQSFVEAVSKAAPSSPQFQVAQQNLLAAISVERQFSCDPAMLVLSDSPSAIQVRQKIGDRNLMAMSPGSKMQVLLETLGNDLQGTGKVVVFTSFERVLEVLKALMRSPPRGLDEDAKTMVYYLANSSLFYDGGLTLNQRSDVINKFLNDPRYRVLFSTDAGGEGLNLQGAASQVIHYDLPLSMGLLEQREGRVYRSGQKNHVIITSLHFAPQDELSKALASLVMRLNAAGSGTYVDGKLLGLITAKRAERNQFRKGL